MTCNFQYLKRWLKDGSVFWISVVAFLCIGCIAYVLPGTLEHRLRYAGLAYETIGVCIVGWVVHETMKSLGAEPFYWTWYQYLKRFSGVFRGGATVLVSSGAAFGIGGGSATLSVTHGQLTGSVEDQIRQLDQWLRDMRAELDGLNKTYDERVRSAEDKIAEERRARLAADADNQKIFTSSLIGDTGWEFAGVGFLLAGIVFAGIANELAQLFGG